MKLWPLTLSASLLLTACQPGAGPLAPGSGATVTVHTEAGLAATPNLVPRLHDTFAFFLEPAGATGGPADLGTAGQDQVKVQVDAGTYDVAFQGNDTAAHTLRLTDASGKAALSLSANDPTIKTTLSAGTYTLQLQHAAADTSRPTLFFRTTASGTGRRILITANTFANGDLSGANLAGADLTTAVLVNVRLTGANLQGAKLAGAVFTGCDLTRTDFTGADIQTARFDGSIVNDAIPPTQSAVPNPGFPGGVTVAGGGASLPTRSGGWMDSEDTTIYKVVVNSEEQYSIWPADRELPLGWRDAGQMGLKRECLTYIEKVWTDMRPLSLRKKMAEMERQRNAKGQA